MSLRRLGRYEIQREIMRGGMANVYLARDPFVDRLVAIKVLSPHLLQDPAFRARFQNEEKVIASIEHEAIVPIYDFGEHQGQPYIVMRYMPGGTLAERISNGPLNGAELRRTVERIADALDEAHAQGMVHRDLKPRNVLFDAKGRAYLTDFGLAKMVEPSLSLTASGIVGTPAYMSPEQAQGEKLDHRSDIYSLGLIVFECLTGRLPYKADTPMGIAVKHIVEPVPQIRQVDPHFSLACESVLARALAKNRADRFHTAGDLARALAQLPELASPTDPSSNGAAPVASEKKPARKRNAPTRVDDSTPAFGLTPINKNLPGSRPKWRPALSRRQVLVMGLVVLVSSILSASGGLAGQMEQPAQAAGSEVATSAPPEPTRVALATVTLAPRPTATNAPPLLTPTAAFGAPTASADGVPMVFIPAGSFQMGSGEGDLDERPVHSVTLSAYSIDQTEVTNGRYAACEAAGACPKSSSYDSVTRPSYHTEAEFANYPVVHVNWNDAAAYCAWAGKRLPTEAEWEYAAKGADGRRYPWGDTAANTGLLNYDFKVGDTTEAGHYPDGASPFNVLDMAGNVYEWVADWYGNRYYTDSPAENPAGPSTGVYRILRGGSWNVNSYAARSADRFRLTPDSSFAHIGFRCAQSP